MKIFSKMDDYIYDLGFINFEAKNSKISLEGIFYSDAEKSMLSFNKRTSSTKSLCNSLLSLCLDFLLMEDLGTF